MTPPDQMTSTIKQASTRQLHAAMTYLRKKNFECAITLAAAAEGMLPPPTKTPTFKKMIELVAHLEKPEIETNDINAISVWLKHGTIDGKYRDRIAFTELDGIAMVTRAVNKFGAVYGERTPKMAVFVNRAIDRLTQLEFGV